MGRARASADSLPVDWVRAPAASLVLEQGRAARWWVRRRTGHSTARALERLARVPASSVLRQRERR